MDLLERFRLLVILTWSLLELLPALQWCHRLKWCSPSVWADSSRVMCTTLAECQTWRSWGHKYLQRHCKGCSDAPLALTMVPLHQVPLVSVCVLVLDIHPPRTHTLNYLLGVHNLSFFFFFCPWHCVCMVQMYTKQNFSKADGCQMPESVRSSKFGRFYRVFALYVSLWKITCRDCWPTFRNSGRNEAPQIRMLYSTY